MPITVTPLSRGPMRRLAKAMIARDAERTNILTRKHFGVSETSAIFDVDAKTIRQWIAEGKLRAWKVGGRGNWRIDQSEIDRLMVGTMANAPSVLGTNQEAV